MKKNVWIVVACLLVLVAMLSGCNKSTEEKSNNSVSTEPGKIIGTNVTFDTGKHMEGEIDVWFYEDGKRFIEPLFEDYRKYRPDVKVNVTYIPWGDYWKKVPVAVSGGNGPDLYYFHNEFQNLMVDGGLMQPYPAELVENLKLDYEGVDAFELVDGGTYYIGTGVGHGIMFYNKSLWAAAGLTEADIPETWEEFREIAIKLTERDDSQLLVSGFSYTPVHGFLIADWSYFSGRFLYSEDGKEVMLNNDDFKKTAQFFTDLYLVDGVGDPQFQDYQQSFKDETTAMLYSHPYYAGILNNDVPDLDYGVFPVPKFEGAERNWHYNNPDVSMGISSKIDDEQYALVTDLLSLFFADDKYMLAWDAAQGLAPTKFSLQGNAELAANPVIDVLMEDMENTFYVGPVPMTLWNVFTQSLADPVLRGGVSIEEAVANTEKRANETLANYEWAPAERISSVASEMK